MSKVEIKFIDVQAVALITGHTTSDILHWCTSLTSLFLCPMSLAFEHINIYIQIHTYINISHLRIRCFCVENRVTTHKATKKKMIWCPRLDVILCILEEACLDFVTWHSFRFASPILNKQNMYFPKVSTSS